MSALHRLKAYFGMVPSEELDEYGPDYRDEYYRSGYDSVYEPRAYEPRAYEAGSVDPGREHATATRLHSTRRPSWAAETPVRGSLAMDTADTTPPVRVREPFAQPRTGMFAEDEGHPLTRIVTLHPHTYNEARPIGERYREGTPVIMNLTGMEDKDAKRLVDFAAGLAFALRGSIDKVTNKVFLLSPPNVDVSAEDRRRIAEGGLFNQR